MGTYIWDDIHTYLLQDGIEIRFAAGAFAVRSALPVANLTATSDTVTGMLPVGGGKATPVKCEQGQPDGSEQE